VVDRFGAAPSGKEGETVKKVWLIGLVFVLVLGLMAVAAVKNPDTLVVATIGDQNTMDPAWCYDTASGEVIWNTMDNLFQYDGESTEKLLPMLATVVPTLDNGLITQAPDGTTYIDVPIRKGVKFHDGTELTPEDVEYCIERAMIFDRSGGPSWMFWEPFSGIKYGSIEDCAKDLAGVDDFSKVPPEILKKVYDEWVDPAVEVKPGNIVEFKLPKPYPPLLQILTHGASWSAIYSKAWAISKGAWDGKATTWQNYHDPERENDPLYDSEMGSGPYILTKWDPGVEVTMEAFDDYWAGAPKIKHAVIKTVEEWGTRRLMLESGDADIVYVPRQYLSQVEGMDGVRIITGLPTLSNAVVFFNSGVTEGSKYVGSGQLDGNGIPLDFFADVNVRKAFCYAFDYQTYIDEAWLGQAIQPTGPIVKGLAYYPENSPVYTYDLAKAEEYFKKAYDGQVWAKGFKMTAVYNSGNDQRKTALEILRDNIESLNPKFHIDVVGVQWSSFLDALVGGQMPVYMLGWLADYPDPHNFVSPYMSSTGTFMGFQGDALVNLAKEKFDPLIEKGITQLAPEDRRATYAELQKLAYDYAIDIFPVQATGVHVERTWVKGWYYNPMRPGTDFYSLSKSED